MFDISTEFDADHHPALVVGMHNTRLADAYTVFLFDDYQHVKPQIDCNLSALRYLP